MTTKELIKCEHTPVNGECSVGYITKKGKFISLGRVQSKTADKIINHALSLKKENESLVNALRVYGDHMSSCSIQGTYNSSSKCTCGYWKYTYGTSRLGC